MGDVKDPRHLARHRRHIPTATTLLTNKPQLRKAFDQGLREAAVTCREDMLVKTQMRAETPYEFPKHLNTIRHVPLSITRAGHRNNFMIEGLP